MFDRTFALPRLAVGLLLAVPVSLAGSASVFAADEAAAGAEAKKAASVLQYKVKDIDGKDVELSRYRGEVLLIVNTASQCGFTPQYKDLEAVYEKYKGQGFAVLAFPANEFGRQEPGSDSEIKQFCTAKYNVTFPLFSKIVVKKTNDGPDPHPLYQFLTDKATDPKFAGEIPWNFTKFLVNRKGEVVARFAPADKPDSEKVTDAIKSALAEPK